ncbi:unnamed protein product [Photorhabdus laumondii subsp. laumondii TTO1]|uniref:Photorhabdus luminescens subsp. laumondii TTO1 complete genome segment 14/17 n=1 Tax=Photorhabdus laumondii subsp. laumondii (strain DSM 15139 / CIP 105565 / TT01) TaxID=243265 RepID=Q7N0B0_PHOLL|nr:unnamed protein product [Photorhabdus laumondii subsp. laumondii TTO1]
MAKTALHRTRLHALDQKIFSGNFSFWIKRGSRR